MVAVNDLDEMDELVEQSYYSSNRSTSYIIGLHFKDLPEDRDVPEDLHYSIRLPGTWYTGSEYPFFQLPGPSNHSRSEFIINMLYVVFLHNVYTSMRNGDIQFYTLL